MIGLGGRSAGGSPATCWFPVFRFAGVKLVRLNRVTKIDEALRSREETK